MKEEMKYESYGNSYSGVRGSWQAWERHLRSANQGLEQSSLCDGTATNVQYVANGIALPLRHEADETGVNA